MSFQLLEKSPKIEITDTKYSIYIYERAAVGYILFIKIGCIFLEVKRVNLLIIGITVYLDLD